MKARKTLTFLSILLCAAVLSASSLPSGHSANTLPYSSVLGGQTSDYSSGSASFLLFQALSEDFSYEWSEKYLLEETRVSILEKMTAVFREILPAQGFLFSVPFENGDSSISLSVLFKDGRILSFVILGDKISAVSAR